LGAETQAAHRIVKTNQKVEQRFFRGQRKKSPKIDGLDRTSFGGAWFDTSSLRPVNHVRGSGARNLRILRFLAVKRLVVWGQAEFEDLSTKAELTGRRDEVTEQGGTERRRLCAHNPAQTRDPLAHNHGGGGKADVSRDFRSPIQSLAVSLQALILSAFTFAVSAVAQ
jgi:hypothetical protein